MKNDEIRLRARRLLNGSRNAEDLNRIFNWLRFRSHGKVAIKEIGDFAAHQDERDQGITWRRAGLLFDNARFFLAYVRAHETGELFSMKRDQVRRCLEASLELIGPARIKDGTGLGMKRAKGALSSAFSKMDVGVTTANPDWTPEEERVIQYVMARFSHEPVFTRRELMDSLAFVMIKERLIEPDDQPALEAQAEFISVYVVSIMHLCTLKLHDGETALLKAAVERNGHLSIGASSEALVGHWEVGTPLFDTECDPKEWCDFGEEGQPDGVFTWEEPLELGPDGRLRDLI